LFIVIFSRNIYKSLLLSLLFNIFFLLVFDSSLVALRSFWLQNLLLTQKIILFYLILLHSLFKFPVKGFLWISSGIYRVFVLNILNNQYLMLQMGGKLTICNEIWLPVYFLYLISLCFWALFLSLIVKILFTSLINIFCCSF